MTLTADFVTGIPTPFRQLRRMMQDAGAQEGVVGGGDFVTSQRAAGLNMSVDVTPGTAWVQIDTSANMGLAHVLSDAVANLAVTTSHATNPRVDIVTLRYNDAGIPAGSGNVPTLQVLAGTATAGAQIATPGAAGYRAGAPALPNDSLWAADILVPATSTTVTNANIVDRRPVALAIGGRGFAQVVTSETTTSLTPVDLATVGPSVTLTLPSNAVVFAMAQADIANSGGIAASQATLFEDAVQRVPTLQASSVGASTVGGFGFFFGLAAGPHTYKLKYNVNSATTGTFSNRKLLVIAISA